MTAESAPVPAPEFEADEAPVLEVVPAAVVPGPPSVHVRALLTWLVIFPLVALGQYAMAPFAADWPIILRAFVLTAVVVPLAVYLAVPRLIMVHGRVMRRRAR